MKSLYAPWRSEYSQADDRSNPQGSSEQECVFCLQLKANQDEQYFIVHRYEHSALIMNKYPYNAGHLLVVPYAHVDTLEKLSPQARLELMEIANSSILLLKKIMKPHGFNVGLNIGKAAGAGIPSHMHMHVLPRWNGDTGFLTTLAEAKTISIDLLGLYQELRSEVAG